MKTHIGTFLIEEVTSSRRKCRKAHFTAHSTLKYKLMSAGLSKDLRKKHGVRSMPVRKDDEVLIQKGQYKGNKGKVTQVYRLRWCIYVEKLSKSKANGILYLIIFIIRSTCHDPY
jgi:large subunit ribosomal protein L26e